MTEEWIWLIYDPGSSACPVPPSLLPPGGSPQGKRPTQPPEDQTQTPTPASAVAPIPRATVGPLPSTPTSKPRPGAVSPMAPPLATPAFGKDGLPPPPPSPGHKSGSGFWSSMPGSPASRPGSFTFPGEAGETLVRQNSNQIQTGSGSGSQTHRHSTHSKEADRMSTCSSASEQSIQSTQSNGVRLVLHRLTPRQREAWSVLSACCLVLLQPALLICPLLHISDNLHCSPASSSLALEPFSRQSLAQVPTFYVFKGSEFLYWTSISPPVISFQGCL